MSCWLALAGLFVFATWSEVALQLKPLALAIKPDSESATPVSPVSVRNPEVQQQLVQWPLLNHCPLGALIVVGAGPSPRHFMEWRICLATIFALFRMLALSLCDQVSYQLSTLVQIV